MKNLMLPPFHHWRQRGPEVVNIFGDEGDASCGAFYIPAKTRYQGYQSHVNLGIIAAALDGWDHVSVSSNNRTPNWAEMMLVHRIFFEDNETSIQYCMPPTDHININPNVLHLWRPWDFELPKPPLEFV